MPWNTNCVQTLLYFEVLKQLAAFAVDKYNSWNLEPGLNILLLLSAFPYYRGCTAISNSRTSWSSLFLNGLLLFSAYNPSWESQALVLELHSRCSYSRSFSDSSSFNDIINSIAHLAISPNPLKRSNGLTGELKKIGQDQKANGWEAIKLKVGCRRSTF